MAKAKFPARTASEAVEVSYTIADGSTHTVRARDGKIRAKHPEGDAVLASMGFSLVDGDEPDEEEEEPVKPDEEGN